MNMEQSLVHLVVAVMLDVPVTVPRLICVGAVRWVRGNPRRKRLQKCVLNPALPTTDGSKKISGYATLA